MLMTIFLVQLAGLLSPGPDFFYVARKAASSNSRNALLGTVGICIGIFLWAVVALFGLAFIGKSTDLVQFIIMVLGGSYLAYSGCKMLKVKENAQFEHSDKTHEKTSAWQEIMSGLAVNVSNAKIAVFFSSVLAGYVSKLNSAGDFFLVLLILVGSGFIYFALISLLFSRGFIRHFYSKYSRYIDNGAGLIFLFFGSTLIYEGIVGIVG